MGLDITYHAHAKKVDAARLDEARSRAKYPEKVGDWAYDEGWYVAYVNPDFVVRADDVTDGAVYEAIVTDGFNAGSYGGYGRWRRFLAKLVGIGDIEAWWRDGAPPGPFSEILHMSDCEGVIGPETSMKLAKDFAEWEGRAKDHGDTLGDEGWWWSRYEHWAKASTAASDDGFVSFH